MKERVTGAIILVALIVLLVPELLTGPPRLTRGTESRSGAIVAATPAAPLRSYTLPLGASAPAAAARSTATTGSGAARTPVSPKPTAATEHRSPANAGAQSRAKPVVPAASAARPAEARARANRHPRGGARWAVQLGVFSVHADALRLGRRVRARGISVRITPMHLRGRRFWRVTTGAVGSRAAGLALARRLHGMGLKGELLRQ